MDDQGRIDFAGLAADRADLDTYVAWVAAVSPRSSPDVFPTPEAKLAYYLNAYNALAMYNVVRDGAPFHLPSDKVRFFYGDKLLVGGQRISLYAFENDVIRPLGDPQDPLRPQLHGPELPAPAPGAVRRGRAGCAARGGDAASSSTRNATWSSFLRGGSRACR